MEQQQFKIRMSLTSKLLLLISVLLTALIAILNYSAISLFFNDKKAYVYDSQAVSAVQTGREFTTRVQNSLDLLKLVLAPVDVSKYVEVAARNNLNFTVDNQKSVSGVELFAVDRTTFEAKSAYKHFPKAELDSLGVDPELLALPEGTLAKKRTELEKNGYAFSTINKSGIPPILVVLYADQRETSGPLPVAIGYISLKPFYSGAAKTFSKTAVLDKDGTILFHSELKDFYANLNWSRDQFFNDSKIAATVSGAREYKNFEGKRLLSSYYRPGFDLIVVNQVEYDVAMKATYTLTEKFVMLAIGALGFMVLAGLLFSRKLIQPLQRLFAATGEVSNGNFEVNIPITTTDEIGALTTSFMAMSRKIVEMLQQMVNSVRVEQEVEIARTVQQSLFPESFIQDDQLTVSSHYQSASECGGDWWGYFKHEGKHVIAIADATGHGLPSALITAAARSCFSVIEKMVKKGQLPTNPGEMLSIANNVIYDAAQGKIMMTFFVGVFDFSNRTFTYASAAHNPPWMFNRQGDGSFKTQSFVANGQRLGEMRENSDFEVKSVPFNEGDTVVFYTDGLIEGKNLDGDQYGKKQSRKILEENMTKEPVNVLEILMKDFMAYNEGKELDDDVTLAVVRVRS